MTDDPHDRTHGLLGNGTFTLASRFSSLAGGAVFALFVGLAVTIGPRAWDFIVEEYKADKAWKLGVSQSLVTIKSDMAVGFERGVAMRAKDAEFDIRLNKIEDRVDRLRDGRR